MKSAVSRSRNARPRTNRWFASGVAALIGLTWAAGGMVLPSLAADGTGTQPSLVTINNRVYLWQGDATAKFMTLTNKLPIGGHFLVNLSNNRSHGAEDITNANGNQGLICIEPERTLAPYTNYSEDWTAASENGWGPEKRAKVQAAISLFSKYQKTWGTQKAYRAAQAVVWGILDGGSKPSSVEDLAGTWKGEAGPSIGSTDLETYWNDMLATYGKIGHDDDASNLRDQLRNVALNNVKYQDGYVQLPGTSGGTWARGQYFELENDGIYASLDQITVTVPGDVNVYYNGKWTDKRSFSGTEAARGMWMYTTANTCTNMAVKASGSISDYVGVTYTAPGTDKDSKPWQKTIGLSHYTATMNGELPLTCPGETPQPEVKTGKLILEKQVDDTTSVTEAGTPAGKFIKASDTFSFEVTCTAPNSQPQTTQVTLRGGERKELGEYPEGTRCTAAEAQRVINGQQVDLPTGVNWDVTGWSSSYDGTNYGQGIKGDNGSVTIEGGRSLYLRATNYFKPTEKTFGTNASVLVGGKDNGKALSDAGANQIRDAINYSGLVVGRSYTLTGELHYADNGEPVLQNGQVVSQTATFQAASAAGTYPMTFDLPANVDRTRDIVVYETMTEQVGGRTFEVAKENNPGNNDQTVRWNSREPVIGTVANVADNDEVATDQDKEFILGQDAIVVDTVSYSGLVPGQSYQLSGKLVDGAQTSTVLATATAQVTADEDGAGQWTLNFPALSAQQQSEAKLQDGSRLVVFEYLLDAKGQPVKDGKGQDVKHENAEEGTTQAVFAKQDKGAIEISKEVIDNVKDAKVLNLEGVKFDFTVQCGTDPKQSFSLAAGEKKLFSDLNVGTKCTFTEVERSYSTKVGWSVEWGTSENGRAAFTNGKASTEREVTVSSPATLYLSAKNIYTPRELTFGTNALVKNTNSKLLDEKAANVISDKVDYSGLLEGHTYRIEGQLHYAYENGVGGQVITDAQGQPVTQFVEFTVDGEKSKVTDSKVLDFAVPAGLDITKGVEVWEYLYEVGPNGEKTEIDNHIPNGTVSNEEQVVTWTPRQPQIGTTAAVEDNLSQTSDKQFRVGTDFTVVDTVDYVGLADGGKYVLVGQLVNQTTGAKVGQEVRQEVTAIKGGAGKWELKLPLQAKDQAGLRAGSTLVVFEKLYPVGVEITEQTTPVAAHAKIDSVPQAVVGTVPPTPTTTAITPPVSPDVTIPVSTPVNTPTPSVPPVLPATTVPQPSIPPVLPAITAPANPKLPPVLAHTGAFTDLGGLGILLLATGLGGVYYARRRLEA